MTPSSLLRSSWFLWEGVVESPHLVGLGGRLVLPVVRRITVRGFARS